MSVDPQSLSLIYHPNPVLRQMGEEVDPSDPTVQAVARKMVEIMLEFNGVGLAAPQVGLAWRLFVTRDPDNEEGGIAWINPVIDLLCDEVESDEEGCLSLPEIRGDIRRSINIRISGHDIDGNHSSNYRDGSGGRTSTRRSFTSRKCEIWSRCARGGPCISFLFATDVARARSYIGLVA